MKKIIYIILSSLIFCSCNTEKQTSCPANRTVSMIMEGKNYAPEYKKEKSMDCPANRSTVSSAMSNNFTPPFENRGKGTECPANIPEKDRLKPEAHSNCPPAAFGAEKLLGYIDEMDVISDKHATYKTDPVSGKKTSQAKGIRTGEIDRPIKATKEELAYYKKKRAEERAILRQIKRDLAEYNKEPPL